MSGVWFSGSTAKAGAEIEAVVKRLPKSRPKRKSAVREDVFSRLNTVELTKF